MKKNIEMVKSQKDSRLLPEGEAKEQRGEFLSMLLDTLGASLLENILAGKGIDRAEKGHDQGILCADYGSNSWSKKIN